MDDHMKYFILSAGLLLFMAIPFNNVLGQQAGITIDVAFPGGNVIIDKCQSNSTLYYEVEGDTVHLRPDLRDTRGDWFYWYFRVKGAANRSLVFQFPSRKVGSYGPAFSSDGGKNWQWLYEDVFKGHDCFSFSFGPNQDEVFFSVGIPYLQTNFDQFITQYKNNPHFSIQLLTISEKGRNVEKILIAPPRKKTRFKVAVTARHHANEAMASYALEGFIASVLEGDDRQMKWLRENVGFFIVPFVDKDGVEDGDQGKNRRPWDHVVDYSDKNIYKSTAALQKQLMDWSQGQLQVALDFHCPWLFGEWNEHIYFVGAKNERIAREQRVFVDAIRNNQRGELILDPDPKRSILDWGVSWNKWEDSKDRLGFTEWAIEQKGVSLSVILEFPFANNNGQNITPDNARLFGKDMAAALAEYLQMSNPK
jgi:hypothetical protein